MIRNDYLGVTSIIRDLWILPHKYDCLISFFRASSWKLPDVIDTWTNIVLSSRHIYRVDGKPVFIADGVKQSKEGRKIPGVKKLGQESENSAKPRYIFAHLFGTVGVLLGTADRLFCALLSMRLHDGNEVIGAWAGDDLARESHVVRTIREASAIVREKSLLLLDRYYLTEPALAALAEHGKGLLDMVVRAKSNVAAHEPPPERTGRRGRPRIKGDRVQLNGLFETHSDDFEKIEVSVYGKIKTAQFLVRDMLWGDKLRKLRFVLAVIDGSRIILASTDLTLQPSRIIELYALRFKIESGFRAFKQVLAGFACHFWSAAMPRLDRFVKNDEMRSRFESINDNDKKAAIVSAFKAMEGFVMFACIALGILQLVALGFNKEISSSSTRWLRTKRNALVSEATTADFLRKTIYRRFGLSDNPLIIQLIHSVQIFSDFA
jgi:hypothetical protein